MTNEQAAQRKLDREAQKLINKLNRENFKARQATAAAKGVKNAG